jgi:hypothetical protein
MSATIEDLRGRPSTSLHFAVGEINGKIDQMIAQLLPQLQALRDADDSLGGRVTSLERGQWLVTGGGVIIVFLVTAWEIIRVTVL